LSPPAPVEGAIRTLQMRIERANLKAPPSDPFQISARSLVPVALLRYNVVGSPIETLLTAQS
jgi:hypothetical protein